MAVDQLSQQISEGDVSSDEAKVYKIGLCQMVEHEALDAAIQGFQDACNELFGEGNVVIDVQNGQGEQPMCSTIINQFVSGTCDLTPLADLEDMLLELFPDVKQVGIVYCSGEPNSEYQASVFEEALKADNVAWKEFTAVDSNDLSSVVTAAIAECDVLWISTDNLCAQYTDIVYNVCEPAGVPVIASEPGMCAGFGVAALGIEYYDIGYRAGEMAYEILVNGADITTMPIETASNVSKICTPSRAAKLGVTLPEDYVSVEE